MLINELLRAKLPTKAFFFYYNDQGFSQHRSIELRPEKGFAVDT